MLKYIIYLDVLFEGEDIDLGDIIYEPPRDGPTLWEIGYPDRTACDFYIPDPDSENMNRLYSRLQFDKFSFNVKL